MAWLDMVGIGLTFLEIDKLSVPGTTVLGIYIFK